MAVVSVVLTGVVMIKDKWQHSYVGIVGCSGDRGGGGGFSGLCSYVGSIVRGDNNKKNLWQLGYIGSVDSPRGQG